MGATCIPNNPKRVVTISRYTLSHALTLGVKPIGSTSHNSPKELTATYLSDEAYLRNLTEGIKSLGGPYTPNLEKILLLNPDLILSWEPAQSIYPLLSQISPTVVAPWKGWQDWKESFNFVAETLGKKEAAQQAWNHYHQRIEKLKIVLGDQYKDKKFSVALINLNGMIMTYAKNSFLGSIFDDLELQRPEAQNVDTPSGAINNISEERLEEIDGDILFVMTLNDKSKKSFEKLQQKPLWKILKAVQQGQVYLVDDGWTWIGSNLLAADAVIDDLYKYLVKTP
ncbi:iron-siderophore ABC transporter substrate-binding protein [Nostocales cyanobacterium LEGE 11386]|nr:iron-siderophore ABC transporter substrate-binding protein [Nostocales cyanobacterium LEGE 11386]